MQNKIKNWLEKHETIYGAGLMFVGLATVAFGGAYLGANMAINNMDKSVTVVDSDGDEYVFTAK